MQFIRGYFNTCIAAEHKRGYLHNALDVLRLFSNLCIDVATTGLGKWQKSARLGIAQNTGLAPNMCKLALDSAQFWSQVVCPSISSCPCSGTMVSSRSQGKHKASFCWVMFGWHFLKERAQENKNLIFIGHHNKNRSNSSSLNRAVAFPPFIPERPVGETSKAVCSGEKGLILPVSSRKEHFLQNNFGKKLFILYLKGWLGSPDHV